MHCAQLLTMLQPLCFSTLFLVRPSRRNAEQNFVSRLNCRMIPAGKHLTLLQNNKKKKVIMRTGIFSLIPSKDAISREVHVTEKNCFHPQADSGRTGVDPAQSARERSFTGTKQPWRYLIGISRIMSRGKIIFMYGIGYMPNVHSTSSCIICRNVK